MAMPAPERRGSCGLDVTSLETPLEGWLCIGAIQKPAHLIGASRWRNRRRHRVNRGGVDAVAPQVWCGHCMVLAAPTLGRRQDAGRESELGFLARYFEFEALGTNLRTEIVAGLTTFLAMAYILFVNPNILSLSSTAPELGMPRDAVFTATALAAAFGCLLMGILARYPVALAPGMGLNAFFAYTVVLEMGIPWQTALSGTLVSGVLFLILSVSGLRERVVNAIPMALKHAVAAGIGLFIAFIGLQNAGIVVRNDAVLVSLGTLSSPPTLLAIFGLGLTALLVARGVGAGIFFGIVVTAAVGVLTGVIPPPEAIVAPVPDLSPTFGVALLNLDNLLQPELAVVVLTMLFVDFFDTTGTLVGVANQAGLVKDNRLPRAGRALSADALATMFSGLVGTSSTTAYIESASGVAAGGRSGFTAVVVGLLFLLALAFSPLLGVVTAAVTAPALILVGALMTTSLRHVPFERIEIALPVFMTLIMMPLTFSIAMGIAIGFITYAITLPAAGRVRDLHPLMAALAVLFLAYFIFLH